MRWLRIARARVRAWFWRDVVADEIREELEFHVDMRTKEYARDGLSPDEAAREARRRVGNLALFQDQGYDVRGGGLIESLAQDVRYGLRSLRNSPTFTTVAVVVVALAIGAGTAIFSVVDAVLLRGLPYDEHDRIAAVLGVDTRRDTTFGDGATTAQTYLDWRRLQRSFEALALVSETSFQWTIDGGIPLDVRAQRVTWEFFQVMRVRPSLGRLFTADDEPESRARVAVLDFDFWQRHFGGDPATVGRIVHLNDQPWRIVGVLPRGFSYPPAADERTDLYVPQAFSATDKLRGGSHTYEGIAIGRLGARVSLTAAEDQMNRVAAALDEEYPAWEPGWRVRVVPLHERLVGEARPWMLLLLGSVALLVLIGCANVANLMLARATVRSREIGIRTAMGASRARLIRALLIESVLLAIAGGAIGTGLAYAGVPVLRAWIPEDVPRVAAIDVDLRVLGLALCASVVTGLLFGLAPAAQSSRPDLTRALNDGDGRATTSAAARRLRSAFAVAQIALAVVLLSGAGLFVGSFVNLIRVEPGFEYRNTLTLGVFLRRDPAVDTLETWMKRNDAYILQILDAVGRVPGVSSVSAVRGGMPFTGSSSRPNITLPGRPEVKGDAEEGIDLRRVTPDYFPQLGMRLVRGRLFSTEDRPGSFPVVIINERAANKYWPGQDPLGEHVDIQGIDRVVVGVVRDIRQYGPELPPRQTAFVPWGQDPSSGGELLVRTSVDPMTILPAVKAAIWSVTPGQVFGPEAATLEELLDRIIAPRRFNMALLGILGALGLVIAAAGIFGVMAYVVAQRTAEIGIRMALGATRGQIISMVLRSATTFIVTGLSVGALAAWYVSSFAEAFLFQIRPTDLRVFAAALMLLALTGLAAAAVPARRAGSVDPLRSLRES